MNTHPIFDDFLRDVTGQAEAIRLAQYVGNLRGHDWSHQFSDDARVVAKGRAELAWLRDEQRAIDPAFVLWNLNAPARCANGAAYA